MAPRLVDLRPSATASPTTRPGGMRGATQKNEKFSFKYFSVPEGCAGHISYSSRLLRVDHVKHAIQPASTYTQVQRVVAPMTRARKSPAISLTRCFLVVTIAPAISFFLYLSTCLFLSCDCTYADLEFFAGPSCETGSVTVGGALSAMDDRCV